MHRFRIIDHRRNALRPERCGETVAIGPLGQADGVLRPDRGASGSQPRHRHEVTETARIAFRNPIAGRDLVLENLQLLDQDRRLHRVEASCQTKAHIVVFVGALAVNANAAQRLGKLVIIGKDGATIAEAAERFCREEAGRGRKSQRADPAALVARAKTLRGVIEHEQALGLRDLGDRIVVGALAEQVDRDHGPGLQAALLCRRDAAFERSGIHVEGCSIDIDEYWRRAGQRHGFAGRAERERRTQDGVPRADFPGHQHHQKRVGAARAAHDMLGAAEIRQGLLQHGHFRTVDEEAMAGHARDCLVNRCAEPATLRAEVIEGNGFWTHVLVHGALLGSNLLGSD